MMYSKVRTESDGSGWNTDFPNAERNLSIRLSEMTTVKVDFDKDDNPRHWVVDINNPGDDSLFTCPVLIASDVGTAFLTETAVDRLREYLFKGGFLWVDDFWGPDAWNFWQTEVYKIFPPKDYNYKYGIVDIPSEHPMFWTLYRSPNVPQVSHISFWKRHGGETSERGEDSAEVHVRGILDPDYNNRVMILMTHNTDIQDTWEREHDEHYFYAFAQDGYSVGINFVLHAILN